MLYNITYLRIDSVIDDVGDDTQPSGACEEVFSTRRPSYVIGRPASSC